MIRADKNFIPFFSEAVTERRKDGRVFFFPEELCRVLHNPHSPVILGIVHQGRIRVRHGEVIAQEADMAGQIISSLRLHIHHAVNMQAHRRVILPQNSEVTVLKVSLPGNDNTRGVPGVAECKSHADRRIARREQVEGSVRPLCLLLQHAEIPVEGTHIRHKGCGLAVDLRVAGPAQPLISLRTVRGD